MTTTLILELEQDLTQVKDSLEWYYNQDETDLMGEQLKEFGILIGKRQVLEKILMKLSL